VAVLVVIATPLIRLTASSRCFFPADQPALVEAEKANHVKLADATDSVVKNWTSSETDCLICRFADGLQLAF
jgi:hypothetical protein